MTNVRTERVVSFYVHGLPKGKARPRITRTGHAYTPAATVAWESQIKLEAVHAMRDLHMPEGTLVVDLTFFFAPPKSYAQKRRELLINEGRPMPHKPDVDNLIKAVLDACNGITYRDDAAVVEVNAKKRYGEDDGVCVAIDKLIFE